MKDEAEHMSVQDEDNTVLEEKKVEVDISQWKTLVTHQAIPGDHEKIDRFCQKHCMPSCRKRCTLPEKCCSKKHHDGSCVGWGHV